MKSVEGYVQVEGNARLYYRILGNGPATVLIPNARNLAAEYESLVPGYRLVFHDQRGRGGSDRITDDSLIWTDYEVRDIEAVRKHLEIKSMAIVGWSYMAGITALYGHQYPSSIERLVMVGPVPLRHPAPYDAEASSAQEKAEPKINLTELERLQKMKKNGLEDDDPVSYCRQHDRVYLPLKMSNPAALDRIQSDPCIYPNEWPKNVTEHWARHFPSESLERDWTEQASSIQVPVLVIHGKEDPIPLDSTLEWVDALPNVRLLVFPDCGHFPHLEAPGSFFTAIRAFLDGGWPEGIASEG
jgi:proline iminopeptidase